MIYKVIYRHNGKLGKLYFTQKLVGEMADTADTTDLPK